jgi:hypothetical protein
MVDLNGRIDMSRPIAGKRRVFPVLKEAIYVEVAFLGDQFFPENSGGPKYYFSLRFLA